MIITIIICKRDIFLCYLIIEFIYNRQFIFTSNYVDIHKVYDTIMEQLYWLEINMTVRLYYTYTAMS